MKSYLLKRFLEDLKSKKQSRQLVIAHTKKVELSIWLLSYVFCVPTFCYNILITAAGFGFGFHDKVMFVAMRLLFTIVKETVPDAIRYFCFFSGHPSKLIVEAVKK